MNKILGSNTNANSSFSDKLLKEKNPFLQGALGAKTGGSYFSSIWIYMKLFFYYPLKYTVLLSIALMIYKFVLIAWKYAQKAYKKFKSFLELIVGCSTGEKMRFGEEDDPKYEERRRRHKEMCKKNKNKSKLKCQDFCRFDLIFFKVPDVFLLFTGILDFFIAIIYLMITIFILIFCVILMIPFNLILPNYTKLI